MKQSKTQTVVLVIIASLLSLLFIFPLLWMFFTSFKGLSESISSPNLLPAKWTFENYIELFTVDTANSPILRWLFNTAFISIAGTALVIFTNTLAAYSIARLNLPAKRLFMGIIIASMTVPGIVIVFPRYFNFRDVGLLDTFAPLILPYASGTLGVFLIYSFLRNFPRDLEEAAYIDGANQLQILRHVVFPSIKPVIATLSVITFIMIYNDFLWPLLVTSSTEMRTVTVGIANLVQGANFVNPGKMMASTLIATVPALLIFIYANKYFVKGVNSTGIK
ncbi:carbohydrate ABC transporter permease [Alkalibacterium sp. f15]|uniref:carbohydrate ABC transporter permease n=1 Tax=Alkalibacterium sp. f15 TaxID=3414029 RepID=UPI003BF7A994